MDTFRLLKYWKTHGVFPVNACSTPRMTITSTIPTTVISRHPSPTNTSPDGDRHKTNHEAAVDHRTRDDDIIDGDHNDEFFNFAEPMDLYFKANEESRSSAVKSAMKIRSMMLKLKKSKGDGAERMDLDDDSVLTTSNQKQTKPELRATEVITRSEKMTETPPGSLKVVRTPSYRNKEELTMFEKLVQTPGSLRLRTPSYRKEDLTMFEKITQTPGSFRLWTPRYQKKEEVTNFERLAQTPGSFRLAQAPDYQRREEVIKSEKKQISAESGHNGTRFSTDLVQKYLKRVKPMYLGVSSRYTEKKLRITAQLRVKSPKVKLAAQLRVKSPREMRSVQSPPSKSSATKSTAEKRRSRLQVMTEAPAPVPVAAKNWKQGNLAARLRGGGGRKNAGKGRSVSSELTQEGRRDDSVLEKEDGIRSAILHCKRSFNGSRDSESLNLPNCSKEPEEIDAMD